MKVAAEHAEAVGQRAWISVEERFLFDRITLDAGDIPPRHAQAAALVEANLADAHGALWNRAAMAARMTANPLLAGGACVESLHQFWGGVPRPRAE